MMKARQSELIVGLLLCPEQFIGPFSKKSYSVMALAAYMKVILNHHPADGLG